VRLRFKVRGEGEFMTPSTQALKSTPLTSIPLSQTASARRLEIKDELRIPSFKKVKWRGGR
jgi:hypothetical protein